MSCQSPRTSDEACVGTSSRECAATRQALMLPEILIEIFLHLDVQSMGRAAQVAWLWHDVIRLPQSWDNVRVNLLEKTLSRYKISTTKHNWRTEYSNLSSSGPFPFIRKLKLYWFTDKMINFTVKKFRNLTSLTLNNHSRQLSDAALTMIIDGLKSLRHLHLGNCKKITSIGLAKLCGDNGMASDRNVLTLYSLSLSNMSNVTDETLQSLSVSQAALQSLVLTRCKNITNRGLEYLTRLLNLHVLDVSWCGGINDDGIVHLRRMVNLTSLSFNPTSRAGCKLLATGNSRLTSLSITNFALDDRCYKSLACFTRLTELCLRYTLISNKALQNLANGPVSLTIDTLDISYCRCLTSEAGRHLAKMTNLRVLHISNSPIGDAGLCHLANAVSSRIEILSLAKEVCITESGLTHLTRLPRLRKIIVCYCDLFYEWRLVNPMVVVKFNQDFWRGGFINDCVHKILP